MSLEAKPCRAMHENIYLKENWAGDLPSLAPIGKCYFDHQKNCTSECNWYEQRKIIHPLFSQDDYEQHYPLNWWKDKTVLDIGADVGSTADFFLRKGAKKIIAVEGNEALYEQLVKNAEEIPGIVPILKFVKSAKDLQDVFEQALRMGPVDVVKLDCEGCEEHLYYVVPLELIERFPAFVIETHGGKLLTLSDDRTQINIENHPLIHDNTCKILAMCNYEICLDMPYHGCRVIYARRKK